MAFGLQVAANDVCREKMNTLIYEVATNFAIFMGMVILTNGLHFLLKPISQPRITSDILVCFFSLELVQ